MQRLTDVLKAPPTLVGTLITTGVGAILLTLVVGAMIYHNTRSLVSASAWVEHTQEVLNSLESASMLTQAIAYTTRPEQARGDKLLAAQVSAGQLMVVARHLGILVSDNANQSGNVKDLGNCSSALTRILKDPAATAPRVGQLQRCQSAISLMIAQERQLLRDRTRTADHRSLVSFRTEFAFVAVFLVTLITLFGFLLRDALVRDRITEEMRRAELDLTHLNQALRKSEEGFRCIIEASPSAMAMTDAHGTVEMANVEMERTFGYGRAELLGMSLSELVPERYRTDRPDARGTSSQLSLRLPAAPLFCGRRKNGSEFPFEISFSPLQTEDGTKVCSAIVDISDRRKNEARIQAALREKDTLLGEIHHRVKNNLQIVHSLLDLQAAKIEDPAAVSMLRDSQHRIRSMALIHQTLYQSNDFAWVDFGHFLDSLAPTLVQSYLANSERIRLTINAADMHLPINAAIPCGLLVNELISNSLKHAFPNERRGEIKIDFIAEPDQNVMLTVSDNGIGIPEGFDLMESESLGLQLVFLLTDQLGGKMTVHRSDPTSFVLRFKVKDPEPAPAGKQSAPAQEAASLAATYA